MNHLQVHQVSPHRNRRGSHLHSLQISRLDFLALNPPHNLQDSHLLNPLASLHSNRLVFPLHSLRRNRVINLPRCLLFNLLQDQLYNQVVVRQINRVRNQVVFHLRNHRLSRLGSLPINLLYNHQEYRRCNRLVNHQCDPRCDLHRNLRCSLLHYQQLSRHGYQQCNLQGNLHQNPPFNRRRYPLRSPQDNLLDSHLVSLLAVLRDSHHVNLLVGRVASLFLIRQWNQRIYHHQYHPNYLPVHHPCNLLRCHPINLLGNRLLSRQDSHRDSQLDSRLANPQKDLVHILPRLRR